MREFFYPKSIAVIGATVKTKKPGYMILANLKSSFKGKLYAVNPKYERVLGVPCYPSLRQIEDKIDLAVIVVPQKAVKQVIKDACEKGVKAVIIISAGFSEAGNAEEEREIVRTARRCNMRIVGPNCLGVYHKRGGVDTFFFREPAVPRPEEGSFSIISQSGALAAAILDHAWERGFGVHSAVSLGNKADVNEIDVINYLKEDVKGFVMYVEGLKEGEGKRLLETTSEVVREGKYMIIYKGGRGRASKAATMSHTASVAGSFEVFRDLLEARGAYIANTFTELIASFGAVQYAETPKGRRVLIITDAGGVGVMLSDMLEGLAKLDKPVDVGGDADDAKFAEALKKAKDYDLVIVAALLESPALSLFIADLVKESAEESGVPHILTSVGGPLARGLEMRARQLKLPFAYGVDEAYYSARILLKQRELIERARLW